jgi:hypothetical protein
VPRIWLLALGVLTGCGGDSTGPGGSGSRLLQSSDLTYLGAFQLPEIPFGGARGATYGFDYAGAGFAYNPSKNSLFISNHTYEKKIAEISIPALSKDLSRLQTGAFLQDPSDITEGNLGRILAGGAASGGANLGGLMVYKDRLIGTVFEYYDAGLSARLSHFTSGLDLARTGDFRGMYAVGDLNPGFYAGYMTAIPAEWQAALGGPALTGQCCLSIISRTSYGPAAFVFDPDDVGVKSPVPATPLVYYDSSHPTLGSWGNTTAVNLDYNMGSGVSGVVFPAGSSSVLFFGTQGTGVPCYGEGTADRSLDRQPVPATGGAVVYCYDPAAGGKGSHAYPYQYWVWAYDAEKLVSVKNGQMKPWEVRPYAGWSLEALPMYGTAAIQGVAYDPNTHRIYLSQSGAHKLVPGAGTYDAAPLIQVFQVNTGS